MAPGLAGASSGGGAGPSSTATYYDEEECLALPVFAAELELLVPSGRRQGGGRPDGVQLLELLQKLAATIPSTEKAVLKRHQRQAEAKLYDVLSHGVGGAVRGLSDAGGGVSGNWQVAARPTTCALSPPQQTFKSNQGNAPRSPCVRRLGQPHAAAPYNWSSSSWTEGSG